MTDANETLGRCLNYALGYLDALAGNAPHEDARTSAQQAAQAIRDASEHIMARMATLPESPEERLGFGSGSANKRTSPGA